MRENEVEDEDDIDDIVISVDETDCRGPKQAPIEPGGGFGGKVSPGGAFDRKLPPKTDVAKNGLFEKCSFPVRNVMNLHCCLVRPIS